MGCHLPPSQTDCRGQRFGNPVSSETASEESCTDGSSLTWPRSTRSPPLSEVVSRGKMGVGRD